MSDQDSLFKEENTNGAADQPAPTDNALQDLLKGIVNENGEQKYKTVADALVGLKNAQDFIPTLQKEKRELESRYQELEGKVSKIDALEATLLELTTGNKEEPSTTTGSSIDPESITKQVKDILNAEKTKTVQEQNLKEVVSAVKAQFGDKAEEVFYNKAKELGMSNEEFNALAARNPKLCLKALDISGNDANKQSGKFAPSNSSLNTAGLKETPAPIFKRPERSVMLGATTQDLKNESAEALRMVQALHEQGMSVHDLSKPSLYSKMFGQ